MKKPSANVARKLPLLASCAPASSKSTAGDWWFAKNSRIRANTTMPRISVATPMLLSVATRRTPAELMIVVSTSVASAINVNMLTDGISEGLSRNPCWPISPSMTNATMQATAVTVTTWAQK